MACGFTARLESDAPGSPSVFLFFRLKNVIEFGLFRLVLALLAKSLLGKSGAEAIAFVREKIPGAIEANEQVSFVEEYQAPKLDAEKDSKKK